MESSQRGALALVRLVAACLIVIALLDAGLYLTQWAMPRHRMPLNILRLALDSIPAIVGIVILVKAKALAEWLSDMIE